MSMEIYDDTGVMALICCHNIPLFFTNIDTPEEQQKYSIVLIEHLFTFLPVTATMIIMYNIGCAIEQSITQVCYLLLYDCILIPIHCSMIFSLTALHPTCGLLQWPCTHMGMSGYASLFTTNGLLRGSVYLMVRVQRGCGLVPLN
jgi:hypothetical protein